MFISKKELNMMRSELIELQETTRKLQKRVIEDDELFNLILNHLNLMFIEVHSDFLTERKLVKKVKK
jgi:hypothetical protein